MNILGISAFYHDSAACLVRDGEIMAAAQEERFTRKKHDWTFPLKAIQYCLNSQGLEGKDLDYVAFYDKPFLKFERILETYLALAPLGIRSFLKAIPLWLKEKLWIKEVISRELNYQGKIIFPEHHLSHAASAFYPSPFPEAAFLTCDGVGEWATTSFGTGSGNKVEISGELKFPHSLGLLYSAFTYFTGFKVNSGEYKLMGLAPYGEPKYVDLILKELIDLKEDGSFRLNLKYFNYAVGLTMTNKRFDRLFGGPPRLPEARITEREMDIASSIQAVTEEVMLRLARHIHKETKAQNLCLAGGVALNCVANGRILREGPFRHIWIQPASGDAGGAIGAALLTWHQYLGNIRKADGKKDKMKGSFLGPCYSQDEVREYLEKNAIPYHRLDKDNIPEYIARLISQGYVIGWFSGRMEFGPRALGSRSIIGDARNSAMQKKMNLKIKFRESFRPFAPSVLEEEVGTFFELNQESPYMLLVAEVRKEKRNELSAEEKAYRGFQKLEVKRSLIPAVTHVDFSSRIHTVDSERNPLYYEVLKKFYEKYHCPVIINTSFNVRGEPIVCTPEEAYRCFMATDMDYLFMEGYLLDKKEQKGKISTAEYLKSYELD